eukprot:TRINITY_DN3492_c0_g1_i1.p1 TRINITY_DN3492_c0_g1~~TRINITY_DN3492_c0_g1_i1.p1  ORF type:complete len:304 (-),score=46.32 TRINITY_DN3492_c0_g1_i1:48-959(-)
MEFLPDILIKPEKASFWHKMLKAEVGTHFKEDSSDPIFGVTIADIEHVTVLKIFSSQAKPRLVEIEFEHGIPPHRLILKTDDMRSDYYVQLMFFVFNELWSSSNRFQDLFIPFIHLYRVVPAGEYGFVECVLSSTPVKSFDWKTIEKRPEQLKTLVCSMAGGFAGSYIMGVRDRHQDNMMIKTDDGTFFHIDFGYLFNNRTYFDAPVFAVPEGAKNLLEKLKMYDKFVDLCGEAFRVLRRSQGIIHYICTTCFNSLNPPNMMNSLAEAFLPHSTEEQAVAKIKTDVRLGTLAWSKNIKDLVHG